MNEWLPYLSLLIAAIACGISTWVAVRAEKWRNADAVGELASDLVTLERRLDNHETRLDGQGLILRDLPTRASFTELKGSIDGMEREFKATMKSVDRELKNQGDAVQRIENHLLERPK